MWLCGKNGYNAPCQQAGNALSPFLSCIRAKQDRFSQISMRDGKDTEKWEGGNMIRESTIAAQERFGAGHHSDEG
jgi:hypothetical protein